MIKNIFSILLFVLLCAPGSNAFAQKKNTGSGTSNHKKKFIKYGTASYYADKFHGRTTASGDIYRHEELTAACNVLPLNSWIKVTNLKNKRSVIVQVNDRLHYKSKRLVDLSKSAARKLGYLSKGIIKVKVEWLKDYEPGMEDTE